MYVPLHKQYAETHSQFSLDAIKPERPPAGFGTRLGASVIDFVMLGLILSFAKSMGVPTNLWVIFAARSSYLVFCHLRYGQTLGKKVFSLRVISTVDDEVLSLKQIIKREIFGRFFSLVIFGIGYLRAIFADDGRAWHDMFSKTQVVSTKASARHPSLPLIAKFAITAGALLGTVLLISYVLIFTSLPLKQWAQNLELRGAKVQGVSGSIARGLTLEHFSYRDDTYEIELNDFKVSYDLVSYFRRKKFVIHNISLASGNVKIETWTPKQADNAAGAPKAESTEDKAKAQRVLLAQTAAGLHLSIKQIRIGELQFDNPTKNIFLKKFSVDNLAMNERNIDIDSVVVESDLVDFTLPSVHLNPERLQLSELGQGVLKPRIQNGLLKKELSFEAMADYDVGAKKLNEFYLGLADRRLQMNSDMSGVTVQTYAFTPKDFLLSGLPIEKLSAKFTGKTALQLTQTMNGSFTLHTMPFKLNSDGLFVYKRDHEEFYLFVAPMALLVSMGPPQKVFHILSKLHSTSEEWLADVYFGKKFYSLSDVERAAILADVGYFQSPRIGEINLMQSQAGRPERPGEASLLRQPAAVLIPGMQTQTKPSSPATVSPRPGNATGFVVPNKTTQLPALPSIAKPNGGL